jgi:hypothetical protein
MCLGVDLVAGAEEAAGVWDFRSFAYSELISRTGVAPSVANMPHTTTKCRLVNFVAQLADECVLLRGRWRLWILSENALVSGKYSILIKFRFARSTGIFGIDL